MQEAIALTWKTMSDRLRNLRFGALASLGTAIALILCAFFLRSWVVLAGLPVLILSGVFFAHREQKILFTWEDRVLALWGGSDLCMGIFVQTMANHPHALKRSLKSLVASLPENADYLVPPADRIKAYRWLFWTRSLLQQIRFARAAAFHFILACLPVSLWYVSGAGWPWILLGLSPICALPLAESFLAWAGMRRWKRLATGLGAWDPGALPDFAARLEGLDWTRIPARTRAAVRAGIRDHVQ
ncbi:MAG TPA: hypothetical protein VJ385_10920 [Fibrobacteria bacterium]|nr:hypothetical protein [Fibrobacteria bacterium]